MTKETVPVTQADREAAWPFRGMMLAADPDKAAWDSGDFDNTDLVQAFARHRLSSRSSLSNADELRALCERLRATRVRWDYPGSDGSTGWIADPDASAAAQAIESLMAMVEMNDG